MNALGFSPAHVPEPHRLEELRPTTDPAQSSLGAVAVYQGEDAAHQTYEYDLVAHPYEADPRLRANTAAEGYVDPDAFTLHADSINEINAHYAPYLTADFYAKYNLEPGTPLSEIVRDSTRTNLDGSFAMAQDVYIELLRDMHKIHAQEAAKFNERLPFYKQDYRQRLEANGLDRLVARFDERADKVRIRYDDGFDTLARGGLGRHEHDGDAFSIVVAPLPSEEHQTLTHEFTHMLEDNGIVQAFPEYPHIVAGIRESVAAHLESYLLEGGDIQAVNPELPERAGSYDTYRNMLDLFCNGGEQQISIHQVIDALSSEEPHNALHVRQAITESFPNHPTLFVDLEALLSNLYAAENISVESQEHTIADFIDDVRKSYEPVKQKASHIGRLLSKLPWLGRS